MGLSMLLPPFKKATMQGFVQISEQSLKSGLRNLSMWVGCGGIDWLGQRNKGTL
jgi:hypothetical protein